MHIKGFLGSMREATMNLLSKLMYYLHSWPLIMAISVFILCSCTSIWDIKPTTTPISIQILDMTPTPEENAPKAEAHEEIRQGKEAAKIIIDALTKYQKDKGKYPDSLEELLPDYLEQIPQTSTKQKYQYLQRLQGIYELWFLVEKENGVSCSYSNRFEDWDCGFSAEP